MFKLSILAWLLIGNTELLAKVHNVNINRVLHCSRAVLEKQIGGEEGSVKIANLLDTVVLSSQKNELDDAKLKEVQLACQLIKKAKNTSTSESFTIDDLITRHGLSLNHATLMILKMLKTEYSGSYNFGGHKYKAGYDTCVPVTAHALLAVESTGVDFGAIVGKCRSSNGRRYLISGLRAVAGAGEENGSTLFGFGAMVAVDLTTDFYMKPKKIITYQKGNRDGAMSTYWPVIATNDINGFSGISIGAFLVYTETTDEARYLSFKISPVFTNWSELRSMLSNWRR